MTDRQGPGWRPLPAVGASGSRPGVRWIWFGIAALVVAVLVPVAVFVAVVLPQFRGDVQYVPADDAAHAVTVPADTRIGLFTTERTGPIPCRITTPDGAVVPIVWLDGEQVSVNAWTATRAFESDSDRVVIACVSTEGWDTADQVRIAPLPNIGLMLGSILGAIVFGMVFTAIGIAAILVTLARRR